jgi:uncharacterized OsmC-like protein/alpha-beta hydrolase superfamily lysophospholipase
VGSRRGWAIFAHCFTCARDDIAASRIARGLARAGIGVLCFDFAGPGVRDGTSPGATFATDIEDLAAAAQAMAAADMPVSLLVGHSLGGAAVLAAAGSIASVRAVATIAAPADTSHILLHLDRAGQDQLRATGATEIELDGRSFALSHRFIEDLQHRDLQTAVHDLHRPLLLMHAPTDDVIGIDNATALFLAARHPKSFVSLDGADHLLSRRHDSEFAAAVIAAWAGGYIPDTDDETMPPERAPGALASETGLGRFETRITIGDAQFTADEPVGAGGGGQGPTPFELVCAGLAACTTMTLRIYADRKGIPLEHASAQVVHERRKDAAPADHFTRTLTLKGPLSEDDRVRLLAISERCPVDLALARGSEVTVVLAEPEEGDA